MTKWEVFSALFASAVTVLTLTAVLVQAIQGDWASAIFFAILWHGFGNNVSLTAIHKEIQSVTSDRARLRRI